MKEKLKMIQVTEEVHVKLKNKANDIGMSLKAYMKYMSELDINLVIKK